MKVPGGCQKCDVDAGITCAYSPRRVYVHVDNEESPPVDLAARAAHNIQGGVTFYTFSGFVVFADVVVE